MKLQISVYRKGCIPKGRTSSFGILNRRHATTHWMFAKEFALRYPRVIVEPDRIYVQDGNIYTSAGVTAGMDLSLALVEEDLGSAVALQVARALVLFLRRPGGQSQFSALLSSQASEGRPLQKLQAWMVENLQEDLSVENLASRVAMSPRNFARVFARELGSTPAHFVEELRLEFARPEAGNNRERSRRNRCRLGLQECRGNETLISPLCWDFAKELSRTLPPSRGKVNGRTDTALSRCGSSVSNNFFSSFKPTGESGPSADAPSPQLRRLGSAQRSVRIGQIEDSQNCAVPFVELSGF
jgi:AraC-like DNA-binding protein